MNMKKIIAGLLLISSTHQALAEGATDTLVPMVMGGIVGYVIRDKGILNNSPQPVVIQQVPSSINYSEPIYQYQIIHDVKCNCDKRVLVRVN
jgi:hypothetical protein